MRAPRSMSETVAPPAMRIEQVLDQPGVGMPRPPFRLRHFDRRSVGWEDKDEPLVLRLVASKEKEAVFEGSGTAGFLRLTYRRTADDALVSVLERGTSEKDAKRQEFRFRRKPL